MKIYVASSWRNNYHPLVVEHLRSRGFEVYDFKNPSWNDEGFHWSEIDSSWKAWNFDQYKNALTHPLAEAGFKSDMDALEWCDVCVLVLPSGRSAHLELGWCVGQGKPTCILHDPILDIEPELMAKMCNVQVDGLDDLTVWLSNLEIPA